MKMSPGVLAGLMLLAAAAPAAAHGFHGGFHGGGFHGGGFHGGHFHGFHGGRFHHFPGGAFFGFGPGLGLAYPWYGYAYPAYYGDLYLYSSNGYAEPDYACGTWIWHPETRSYGWLACGATSDLNAPTASTEAVAPPASPQAPQQP